VETVNLTSKTLTRRTVLQLSAGAAALSASIETASALDYPTRSVKIVVPVPPGGALDIHARLIGKYLAEHMGQSFIIENKPGAATNLGVEYVVRAPADGYTLLLMPSSVSVNETLYTNLSFHIPRDIIPVAMISSFPLAMEVNLSVPAKTVPEFIAYVKANPGKISIATSGNGSPQHMAGAFFMLKTGTQMTYVPYHGGAPAITDLMGGQIQVYFSPLPESMAVIKAGKVRALAVTSAKRSPVLPDVPTVAETVPGLVADTWQGIAAPKGTPDEIVDKLNKGVNAALADPGVKAQMAALGSTPMPMSPQQFKDYVVADIAKWAEVIRDAHITPEN
jgi:tripartite-type tricarboxylate transporter receptor subunit TctC